MLCGFIGSKTKRKYSDELIEQLGKTVQEAEVPKAAIGWELEELEAYVQRVQNGERELDSDDE